jgi:hypothetical protein
MGGNWNVAFLSRVSFYVDVGPARLQLCPVHASPSLKEEMTKHVKSHWFRLSFSSAAGALISPDWQTVGENDETWFIHHLVITIWPNWSSISLIIS